MSPNDSSTWSAIVATGLSGTLTGCLAFVSFVDVRSFLKHVSTMGGTDLAKRHFQVWWPYGRDLMLPLVSSTTIAHAVAWRLTKDPSWGWSCLCCFVIAPYTGLVLGEDIAALRKSDSKQVKETTRRFCNLHHTRLGLAAASFGMSLLGLAKM